MNKILIIKIFLLCLIPGIIISCDEREIVDTNYPEQGVYFPVSRMGIYEVNDTTDTTDLFARYAMDAENNKFLIPIGIYRSGINCEGNVTVNLGTYNDTIQDLIDADAFNTEINNTLPEILPADSYVLPASVEIKSGDDYAVFNLEIDLPFIQSNLGKRYALAMKITGSSKTVNNDYNTAIIDFDTRFTGAKPFFTFKETKDDAKKIEFTNMSTYGLSYEWDFGDGQKSTEKDPGTHAYSDFGSYVVSLKSTGIDGMQNVYTFNVVVWDVITNAYINNPGGPFERAGEASGRTDILTNWSYTANVLSTVSGGKNIGGWQGDNNGVMDFYANASTTPDGLKNAKIYQTFELEAGHYQFGFTQYSITGVNNCFAVVASGTQLPDIENMDSDVNVLAKFNWTEADDLGDEKQGLEFTLNSKQTITVGFVVSNEVRGRVKIESVSLAK